jgi:molybdopterin synthase sulfur carrier subunit
MIAIRIPTPLRQYSSGKEEGLVEGADVRSALEDLDRRHPGLRERLVNEKGALRPYINVFLNDEDVRYLDGLGSALKAGDKLAIVPAIAGGAC